MPSRPNRSAIWRPSCGCASRSFDDPLLFLSLSFDLRDLIRGEVLAAFLAYHVARFVIAYTPHIDALDSEGGMRANRKLVPPGAMALVAVVSDERPPPMSLLIATDIAAVWAWGRGRRRCGGLWATTPRGLDGQFLLHRS